MDDGMIFHQPRHLDYTIGKRLEVEREILIAPDEKPEIEAKCPNCASVMMYRGRGHLRTGRVVYYFECVHSYREVYSLSITLDEST